MVEVKNQVWCSRFIEGINENTKLWNGYIVAWLGLLPGFGCWSQDQTTALLGKTNEGGNYKLWRDDNHAVCIDGKKIKINDRLHYIHENPVINGLVFNDWDYVYSSAKDYQTGKTGLVNIEFPI